MPNYYDILGVSKDASDSEIKKAFRALSLKHHPDRGGDTQQFQEINEAYETLTDPSKKAQHDMELNGFPGGMHGIHFSHTMDGNDFGDINNIFNMMFGGGMSGMPGMHAFGGPDIRIFHNGIPVHGGGIFHNLQKPPVIVKNVHITLEQAYQGVSLPIEVERWVIIDNNMKRMEKETVYVSIPAGIDENEVIVMRDKGNVVNESLKGDVKIAIQIENNTPFKRYGLDIVFKKTITLKEALCGFSFELKHLNGKQLCLNNNTNKTVIKPNCKRVIPNMGINRENNTGNLIIEFDIEFPDSLTEEQMRKLSEVL